MSKRFSHSRLSSFENCPKQFHFRYVLEIPADSEGIEAFVGKRVHEVLERLYIFVSRGQIPPLEKVIARYHAIWDEHFEEDRIRIVREGTPVDFYRELGVRCIHHYYRNHYPFDGDETLGIERHVAFDLDDDGHYPVQGIIDRIVRAPDGTVEIHDYKTGQYVPSQKQLDQERQLALYQLGVSRIYGESTRYRLVWHYLARGQTRTSTRTPDQLDALRQDTISLIDTIRAETDFEPRKIKLCDWCEYKPLCPLWNPDSADAIRDRMAAMGRDADARRRNAPAPNQTPTGQLELL